MSADDELYGRTSRALGLQYCDICRFWFHPMHNVHVCDPDYRRRSDAALDIKIPEYTEMLREVCNTRECRLDGPLLMEPPAQEAQRMRSMFWSLEDVSSDSDEEVPRRPQDEDIPPQAQDEDQEPLQPQLCPHCRMYRVDEAHDCRVDPELHHSLAELEASEFAMDCDDCKLKAFTKNNSWSNEEEARSAIIGHMKEFDQRFAWLKHLDMYEATDDESSIPSLVEASDDEEDEEEDDEEEVAEVDSGSGEKEDDADEDDDEEPPRLIDESDNEDEDEDDEDLDAPPQLVDDDSSDDEFEGPTTSRSATAKKFKAKPDDKEVRT